MKNKNDFEYITPEFRSNCFIEAIKAKFQDWKSIELYFCKPRIAEDGRFQCMHLMWSDGVNDYDFSDKEDTELPWYKCFLFQGAIRKFELGFAERYARYRNGKRKHS